MDLRPYDNTVFYDSMGMRLWERRHQVLDQYIGIDRILDIGCNDGKLLERLSHSTDLELLVGLDIDAQVLEKASENLRFDQIQDCLRMNRKKPCFIYLYQGDALLKYQLLKEYKFTVITLIELIEHLELPYLDQLCENVFGFLNPQKIIITTPNSDFNIYFKQMDPLFTLRHPDHKYEFSQKEFKDFCEGVAQKYSYSTHYDGVGKHRSGDLTYGYASQICVFTRVVENQQEYQVTQQINQIMEHCCPYDPRSPAQKLGDEIRSNYMRFSLHNVSDLNDQEYDLLQQYTDDVVIRIADLQSPELIDELTTIDQRFTRFNNYLVLKMNQLQ